MALNMCNRMVVAALVAAGSVLWQGKALADNNVSPEIRKAVLSISRKSCNALQSSFTLAETNSRKVAVKLQRTPKNGVFYAWLKGTWVLNTRADFDLNERRMTCGSGGRTVSFAKNVTMKEEETLRSWYLGQGEKQSPKRPSVSTSVQAAANVDVRDVVVAVSRRTCSELEIAFALVETNSEKVRVALAKEEDSDKFYVKFKGSKVITTGSHFDLGKREMTCGLAGRAVSYADNISGKEQRILDAWFYGQGTVRETTGSSQESRSPQSDLTGNSVDSMSPMRGGGAI